MKRLTKTQSICPQCRRPLTAWYTERDGKVFFEKTCPEHGNFSALAANSAADYQAWIQNPVINIPPKRQ